MASKERRKAKNRLSELEADEVSIVPAGKNLRKYLLTKEQPEMDEFLKKILEGELSNETEIDTILKESKLSPEQQKAAKGAVRLLQSVGGSMPEAVMKELSQLAGVTIEPPKEDKEKAGDKAATRKELLAELRKEGYEIQEPKPQEEPMDQKVQDQLAAIRKESSDAIEAAKAENKSLKEELQKERDIRLMSEFKSKAEGMGYRGEEAEKVGKTLKIAKEKFSEEDYASLEATVKAGAKKDVSLFKELGSSQGSDKAGGYEQKLEAAKAEIRKEHSGWSNEKLEAEAIKRDPSLYSEYLDANPKQGGR